jgi:outer membrane translocation and assembly module TamA
VVEGLCLSHWKVSRYHTLVARLEVAAGFGWSGNRQMLLGSSTGLRGYAEGAFSGDRLIRYSLEHRVFSDLSVLFFRLGAAAFLDGGTAWFGGDPLGRKRFSNAVGMGLRIENTKVQGPGLIRIDVAMNLDERRMGHVTLSSALPFSAFLDLDPSPSLFGSERD